MYRDQADFSDMPLDAPFEETRKKLADWTSRHAHSAAQHFTDATHRASARVHGYYDNAKDMAGHSFERAKGAVYSRKTATSSKEMTSNINLCECSRRVQGHLAILYPELH